MTDTVEFRDNRKRRMFISGILLLVYLIHEFSHYTPNNINVLLELRL